MSRFLRGCFIVWVVLRYGLDELVLSSFDHPWIRRLTRIVSTGHVTDWQEPDEDEWVLVLQGSGTLHFARNDRMLVLGPGDWCHIPAGARHRVEETDPHQPTVWLAVHFPGDDG